MSTLLEDSQTVSTTGVKAPNSMTKFPEGGATFHVAISSGQTATVQLRAWVIPTVKETIATFTLGGNEPLSAYTPISAIFKSWDWNVTAISGGTLSLYCIGLGL